MEKETRPMCDRLREYIDANAVSRKLISKSTGISESELSKMLNGKRTITVDAFEAVCKAMSVNPRHFYESD